MAHSHDDHQHERPRDLTRNQDLVLKTLNAAEAPLSVIRGRYRYRLLVKATREADLQAYLRVWLGNVPKARGDTRLGVDIDPYSFL